MSMSSMSRDFWHETPPSNETFPLHICWARQCALDLENPSQNCLNATILKENTDTNVKNQGQQG